MNNDYSIRIQTEVTCAIQEGHSMLPESATWGWGGGLMKSKVRWLPKELLCVVWRMRTNSWRKRDCLCAQLCLDLFYPLVVSRQLLCPWDFPGKNTGVGCHFLQGIFPTQGSNLHLLCLLHCGQILYCWAIGEGKGRQKPCKQRRPTPMLEVGMNSQWGPEKWVVGVQRGVGGGGTRAGTSRGEAREARTRPRWPQWSYSWALSLTWNPSKAIGKHLVRFYPTGVFGCPTKDWQVGEGWWGWRASGLGESHCKSRGQWQWFVRDQGWDRERQVRGTFQEVGMKICDWLQEGSEGEGVLRTTPRSLPAQVSGGTWSLRQRALRRGHGLTRTSARIWEILETALSALRSWHTSYHHFLKACPKCSPSPVTGRTLRSFREPCGPLLSV